MNPNTGALALFETDDDAKKAGHTVKLSSKQTEQLLPMNRKQRRAWAAQQRRKAPSR